MTFLLFKINLLELELIRHNGDFSHGSDRVSFLLTCCCARPFLLLRIELRVENLLFRRSRLLLAAAAAGFRCSCTSAAANSQTATAAAAAATQQPQLL